MSPSDDERDVWQVVAAMQTALYDRDAGAVALAYAADAVVADLAPPLIGGFDEAALAGWLASWAGPVEETWHEPRIVISGDLAICYGLVRVRAPTAEEGEASWWTRRTACLRRTDGRWLIFHDHVSVPFYMDGSNRAALDLGPDDAAG